MGRLIDLTGQKFGDLVVVERSGVISGYAAWSCLCGCGRSYRATGKGLRSGRTRRCLRCANVDRGRDILGQTFGRLTVIERLEPQGKAGARWRCRCRCGEIRVATGGALRHGDVKACRTCAGASGLARRPEYHTWKAARRRCSVESDIGWSRYGGRGIRMCERWQSSFARFYEDVGPRPSQEKTAAGRPVWTLDRIDPNGHYSCGHCRECVAQGWPANCRWVTWDVQSRNKRTVSALEAENARLRDELSRLRAAAAE